jgi:hypothetical protein
MKIKRRSCIQCNLPVVIGRNYCRQHLNQRGCVICRRRLQDGLFATSDHVCNACVRKRQSFNRIVQGGGGQKSVNSTFLKCSIDSTNDVLDPLIFIQSVSTKIDAILREGLAVHSNLKWYLTVEVTFERITEDGPQTILSRFANPLAILLRPDEIDHQLDDAASTIMGRIEDFIQLGSGWSLHKINEAQVCFASFNPIGGSSYIATPRHLASTKGIINVRNTDNRCFLYAILAQLYPVAENTERASKYMKHLSKLNVTGITFPMTVQQIDKFEKLNPDISINVLHLDQEKSIVPLFTTKCRGRKYQVNLLLLSQNCARKNGKVVPDRDGTIVLTHYTLIKNLSKLFSTRTASKAKTFVCTYCLHRYTRQDLLDKHLPDCSIHKACAITFPSHHPKCKKQKEQEFCALEQMEIDPDEHEAIEQAAAFHERRLPENILTYKDIKKEFPVPFVIYADFESFIVNDTHEPSGFCALRVSSINYMNNEEAYVYSGPNVMQNFYEHIIKERDVINAILERNMPIDHLSCEQQQAYDNAIACKSCNKQFVENNHKVRHHNHVTGKFLGATCNNCNLQLKFRKGGRRDGTMDQGEKKYDYFIPVICHNMRNYDGHLIISHLEKKYAASEINVLASSTEKYIAFQIGQLRFLDSLQFLNASLDSLVSCMKKDGTDKFVHTKRHFPNDTKFALVCEKGLFPYEHMNGIEKFEETSLPPIEKFYSKLTEEGVSATEYSRAQLIWDEFNILSMHEYHDLYLKTDVLLLADIFENFRRVTMENYKLDAAHFYTLPGLSMSACLKYTNVQLELFTEPDQLLFVERGIRGGVSTINNRYSKANNPYVAGYNPDEPTKYIMYLDANNLYGCAMTESLPTGNFRFEDVENFDIDSMCTDENVGYILEVDLLYPKHLHDSHNNFPLAPETLHVSAEMHSAYAKELLEKLDRKVGKTSKLIPNLMNKERYVVHYKNLQFYMKMGLIVTKIHRVMSFTQSPWLAKYIEFNTEKRRLATTSFEKDFYKLLSNAVFGKLMQNLRLQISCKLVTDTISAERYIAQPTFDSFNIINDDVTMIKMNKAKIYWDKPTYAGFCVLELSKLHMYKFHYEYIAQRYGSNAKLLFTDTDSLCYELTTKDAYEDMRNDLHLYDTSAYPKDHPNYSVANCKKIGKFKDECDGIAPVEFVGLRPKMYSLLLPDTMQKATAKGVKRSYAKKYLKHEEYRKCLFDECSTTASFHTIRSKNHQLRTENVIKEALSPFDDKRYLVKGTSDTLAYGHYKIM